jgi:scyllo-inositol 2-dehydrogenase (NADP+)
MATGTSTGSKRPRVVVVGYGSAGRRFHSYLIGLTGGLELYGIAARRPELREQAAQERSCRTFENIEQVLDDPAVDLVVLATPHDTHAPLAIQALQAGKHVVTDKVMCMNLAECDRMIAAAQRSGRMLNVFHNRRWDGDFLTLRKAMADGILGELRWIEMAWQRYGVWKSWRGQRARGGGRLRDLGSHMIDQLLLLFPEPVESVYCRMHHDWPEVDVESHAMVTLTFAGGQTAICDVSSMARIEKPRIWACGTSATLVKYGIDPQEQAMIAGDIDAAREDPACYAQVQDENERRTLPTLPGRWRSFYENIADALAGRAEPAVRLDEMRRLIAVIDACFQSAETGRAVAPAVQ